jgi:hypothetical protein
VQYIGNSPGGSNGIDGYLTEINFVDGSQLTPSSFGETDTTTGSWKPKAYTGTYGTNGFYLKFSDIATTSGSNAGLGKDFSGNTNYWDTNNISVTAGTTYDAMIDSPTLTSATVANYAVLNPLDKGSDVTISAGNLAMQVPISTSNSVARSSIGMSSGKWYWEVTPTTLGGTPADNAMCGLILFSSANTSYLGSTATGYGYYGNNGQKYNNNAGTSYGATYTSTDVIGVAFDADNGTLTFYKNNTSQGTAFTGLTAGVYFAALGNVNSSAFINFGQRPFSYTPPTGFVRLNTFNLPDSTIVKGNTVMDATAYSGTNVTNVIVNQGQFRPDLVWCKGRSASGSWHALFDTVRGATKGISSNATDAEYTSTAGNDLASFNSNGFTVGTTQNWGSTNQAGQTMVGWQWQAGQGSTSSNTSGTITSTVSVNATAGFSVVIYTGTGSAATIGHGLGVAPKMIIVKNRDAADAWQVYHAANTANPETDYLVLNTTAATADAADRWNDTLPTSTVFSIGNGVEVNTNTEKYVAYCWAEIAGFSKFGSYTGNGSTDGVFVYTGFRPRWVLIKHTNTAGNNWRLVDTSRLGYNADNYPLFPSLSDAESATVVCDLLSNGIKFRSTAQGVNGSGDSYIYAAFAENPFKNANAR